METLSANQIDISDVEPEAVSPVRDTGIIKTVKIGAPNEKGNQSVFIVIEYPVGSPNKQVIAGSLTYNEQLFKDKTGLTDGQIRYYNMNKARIKELRLAASDDDFTVQTFSDLKGRQVGFSAGPSGLDVSRYEFKSFFKA